MFDVYMNSQNCSVIERKPTRLHRYGFTHKKVGVWNAVSQKQIVGPIFFEKTVDCDVYCSIISPFIAIFKARLMLLHISIR